MNVKSIYDITIGVDGKVGANTTTSSVAGVSDIDIASGRVGSGSIAGFGN